MSASVHFVHPTIRFFKPEMLSSLELMVIITDMLDLKYIRDNLEAIKTNTLRRHVAADPDLVAALYEERIRTLKKIEAQRQKRNENAHMMKARLSEDERAGLIEEGKKLRNSITSLETSLEQTSTRLQQEAARIPNLTHPDAPRGEGEEDNLELKRWGTPQKFSFAPRDHLRIGQELDLIDFETAARTSGQKFYFLRNEAVLLELGLIRYGLDLLLKEGFVPTITPDIAKADMVEGIGFNPRGEESNIYSLEGTDTCLVGTAEITLGSYYAGQIMDAQQMPVKLAGLSHCFRREAGAAGQYSKGLYRVHQFSKLEMFVFCLPSQSEQMHLYLLDLEEKIYQGLEIPYRVVDTCSGELGGPAYRKYDLEAWMPGRGESGGWGEITSASNCTDYQARRLGVRVKVEGKNIYAYMLNGTAIAVSRTLIALLENFQQADGSVTIPERLVPYTGFDRIAGK
jgi:seryl-tRNA synthetase